MKRIVSFLLICFVASAFLFAVEDSSMLFLWGKKDPSVNFFRYSIDGEDWITVGTEQRDAVVSYTKNEDHEFFIEQSYDGEHWSEPYSVVFSKKPEVVTKTKNKYDRLSSSLVLVPFETYIATKAHGNSRTYQSVYAAGLELSTICYVTERVGLGLALNGTYAYIGQNSRRESLNFATYGIGSYRFVSRDVFDVVGEVGLGAQYEFVKGKFYMSPSVLLQLDASWKMFENLCLTVSPSLSASFSDFKLESDYMAYNIRAVALGIEYQL